MFVEEGQLLSFVDSFGQVDACYVSLPPGDVFLTQLACPLNDIIFVYFLSDWSNWEH